MRLITSFSVLIFSAGSCSEEPPVPSGANEFNDLQKQELSSRIVIDNLTPKDSILLVETYGILNSTGMIAMDSEALYIADYPALNILKISKETLDVTDTLSISEGQGPQEIMRIDNYTVSDDFVAISDESLGKIQIWNKQKELVNEFLPENIFPFRVNLWPDGALTVQSPRSVENGSIFYTLDPEGNLLNTFGDVSGAEYNPIRYSGENLINEGYYYFAGYSEHVIAKWDRDGNLQYAVSTIDDFPGEANLISSVGTEQGIFQFAPNAFFSANSITVYNNSLVLVHRGDRNDEFYRQHVDLYNKHNGLYIASLQLPQIAGQIEIDENYIFTLQRMDGEEQYLVLYENYLEELLRDTTLTISTNHLIKNDESKKLLDSSSFLPALSVFYHHCFNSLSF